jgi:hypothetical protein
MDWRRLVLTSLGAPFGHPLDAWAVSAVYSGLLSMRTTGSLVDSSPAHCVPGRGMISGGSSRYVVRPMPGQKVGRPGGPPNEPSQQAGGSSPSERAQVSADSSHGTSRCGSWRSSKVQQMRGSHWLARQASSTTMSTAASENRLRADQGYPRFLIVTPVRRKIRTPGGDHGGQVPTRGPVGAGTDVTLRDYHPLCRQ